MTAVPQKDFSRLNLDKDTSNIMDNLQQNQNTGDDSDDDSVILIEEEPTNQNEVPVYCIDQENENKEADLHVKLIEEGKYLVVFENKRIRFEVPATFFGFTCCQCQNKSSNMFSMMRHIFISHCDGEGKQMPNYTVDSERDEQFNYQEEEEEVKQQPEIEQEPKLQQQIETESPLENEEEAILDAPLFVDSSFDDMSSTPISQDNPSENVPSSSFTSSASTSSSGLLVNQNNTPQNLPKLTNCGDGLYSYGKSFFLYTYEYICVECQKVLSIWEIVAHSETCLPDGQQAFEFGETDYNEGSSVNLVGVPKENSKTIHSLSFD